MGKEPATAAWYDSAADSARRACDGPTELTNYCASLHLSVSYITIDELDHAVEASARGRSGGGVAAHHGAQAGQSSCCRT